MRKHLLLSIVIIGIVSLFSIACIKKEFIEPAKTEQQQSQLRIAPQDTIRVIIYWGQSNCNGIVPIGSISYPELTDTIPYSFIFNRSTYLIEKMNKNNAMGESNSVSCGAELRLMYELGQRDNKYRLMLKWGAPGSYIANLPSQDWNVAGGTNEYYYKLKIHAFRVRKQLQDAGHVVVFEKMIAYIGESDSIDSTNASNFYNNMIAINNGMKAYLGVSAANMQFITIRTHNIATYAPKVRCSQALIGTMVDTDEWKPTSIHIGAGSYDSLGRKLATLIY